MAGPRRGPPSPRGDAPLSARMKALRDANEAASRRSADFEVDPDGTARSTKGSPAGASATYRSADFDYPVTVTGFAGERDGVRYFTIEGSSAAIPESQLVFRAPADMDRILNAQQADPGVEADAASPEGTVLEERTAPPQRQVWTQDDTLRTIDQVHSNSEKILGRMIRDSQLATGNKPQIRPKFAGKTLQPKAEFEQAVAAAIDLRREMAKPNPSVQAAWGHTQKLLQFMRGKEWANEIVPDLSVFEPDAIARAETSNAESPPRKLPSGLIEEGGDPVRTPVLRGPEDRRNASGQQQYDAVESARKLFDDRLDALRRTIRGTFQGEALNATDATTLAKLNQIVSENIGTESSRLGIGSGDSGKSPQSPAAAVAAIERHMSRSAPAGNQRTSVFRTAPPGEVLERSSPTRAPSDAVPPPGPNTVDPNAREKANAFSQRLSRLVGEEPGDPFVPSSRPPEPADVGAPPEWTEERASAWRASEAQRKADMEAAQPARRVAGTVQRPEVIRQRLAELNEQPAEPEQQPRLGYETFNAESSASGVTPIADRIEGKTRDPLPEAGQQEINAISRYRVRLQGTPTMPEGGSAFQSTNKPMLVQEIAKRDGSGQWEDLTPLNAEVRQYGDTYLIISQNGQPFEVSASDLAADGSVLPRRIDLQRARQIASSGKGDVLQTPRDIERARLLDRNRKLPRERRNFEAMPDDPRRPADAARNPAIDVAATNRPTLEAARAAATELERQLQSNDLGLSRSGDDQVAPETLATVLSFMEENPGYNVADLLDGPTQFVKAAELRKQRERIGARADISEAEKAEMLAGITQAEFEQQYSQRGATRMNDLLADRSRVRAVLGRVLDPGRSIDAATPMTLYSVDWLNRNARDVFAGPEADVRLAQASAIERVVTDQFRRPAPDATGARPPLGPQASEWRSRMREEMGRQGISNLAIFGDLESDVNLQLQSRAFDDSARSAGETFGLRGAGAGLEPDRRRAAGPRPDVDDDPSMREYMDVSDDSETDANARPDTMDDLAMEVSPQYRNLLERARYLAMRAGIDESGDVRALLERLNAEVPRQTAPTRPGLVDGLLGRRRPGPAAEFRDSQATAIQRELEALNAASASMIPRENSTGPGTLEELFGNDDQRRAWARSLFGGTQEQTENNMRMLFLTWLNNPLARNAIDRQGKSGVNPYFAAPRQSAEGADLGPIDSSNVEWTMSRLDDLEQQRRELTGGIFQREMEDALVDSKPLIPPHRRNNARLARIDSEIAALKESNPGIFQSYQQFKDEVGYAFRPLLEEMPAPNVGGRPERPDMFPAAREFFGFGDRPEGMTLRQRMAGGKPIQLPGRRENTRIAELTQLLDSVEAVAGSGERGIDPTVSNPEQGLLVYLASNPEGQLTDADIAGIRQVLNTGEGAVDPSVIEKLRRGGAFGEAILRGELPDAQLGVDPALRKNADMLSASRTIPISERFEVADEAAGAAKIAEIQSDSTGQYAGLRPSKQLVRENGKLFVEAFKEAPAVRSSLTADFYVPPSGPAIPRSSPTAPAMRDGVVSFGSEMYTPANMPASRLQQIRGLQRQLSFARTPSEIAPIQAQIDQLSRGVRAVDTQETPTVAAAERQARAGIPDGAGEAVQGQLDKLAEILQAVTDARGRTRSAPDALKDPEAFPVRSAGFGRAITRNVDEPAGPLGMLQIDEQTLSPLDDMARGSGFYVEPGSAGDRLLESIAGLRRPVSAGELMDNSTALAAEMPKDPQDVARMALERLANARVGGKPLGIDITDMAFDDSDLAQRLQGKATQFRQLAQESGAEAGGYVDDNSKYLEAVANQYEEAARAVNEGYIRTRADRGIADDARPGQAVSGQNSAAQPRVYLGGGRGAFFKGADDKMFLRANVEGGRPLFVPIDAGQGANWSIDSEGRLQRQGVPAPQRTAPAPAEAPETPDISPDLDEPQIDDMGAGIPGMGAPVAMNAAPGDTNTYVNDPEAVLRRLRQSVRPAAVMA